MSFVSYHFNFTLRFLFLERPSVSACNCYKTRFYANDVSYIPVSLLSCASHTPNGTSGLSFAAMLACARARNRLNCLWNLYSGPYAIYRSPTDPISACYRCTSSPQIFCCSTPAFPQPFCYQPPVPQHFCYRNYFVIYGKSKTKFNPKVYWILCIH